MPAIVVVLLILGESIYLNGELSQRDFTFTDSGFPSDLAKTSQPLIAKVIKSSLGVEASAVPHLRTEIREFSLAGDYGWLLYKSRVEQPYRRIILMMLSKFGELLDGKELENLYFCTYSIIVGRPPKTFIVKALRIPSYVRDDASKWEKPRDGFRIGWDQSPEKPAHIWMTIELINQGRQRAIRSCVVLARFPHVPNLQLMDLMQVKAGKIGKLLHAALRSADGQPTFRFIISDEKKVFKAMAPIFQECVDLMDADNATDKAFEQYSRKNWVYYPRRRVQWLVDRLAEWWSVWRPANMPDAHRPIIRLAFSNGRTEWKTADHRPDLLDRVCIAEKMSTQYFHSCHTWSICLTVVDVDYSEIEFVDAGQP